MNERLRVRLRDFMERDDAWGTEEGRTVYTAFAREVERHPGANIIVVSLDGVKRTDASFPRESVMEVARKYRKRVGFCLTDLTNEDLFDNWDAAAQKKEQPIAVWFPKGYRLLGPQPSPGNADVFSFVLDRFETRAVDITSRFSLKISNASMKLKQLWEQGFILRQELASETGGIEFVYLPIR